MQPLPDHDNHHNAAMCPYCTDNGAFVMVPRDLLKNVDKWSHVGGSPYSGGCGVHFRDTNPPCTCGLDALRQLVAALP